MLATGCSTGSGSSSSGPACSGAPIKVAAEFPLTGPDAALGVGAAHGAQFAIESKKCAGAYPLKFVAFDDVSVATGAHDPATGARNVEKMLADPQVLGMVGPLDSNVARAEIPIANLNNLAMISPSNTDECLTQALTYCPTPPAALRPAGGNQYFRLAADNTLQGPAAATFAVDSLKVQAVAVLSDNETLGKAVADGFSSELRARGGSVVLRQDFDWRANNDYAAYFRLAKQQGAQAVFVGMTSQTHGCTVRPAMRGILDVPLVGPDGIVDDQCLKDATGASDGMYGTVTVGDATQSSAPDARSVVAAYRQRFGDSDLSAFTFPSYDAAALMVDAITRAAAAAGGRPTRKQVIEAVARTSAFKGVTGTFAFNAAGDPLQPTVSIFKSQGSGWVFATQFPVSRRA